MLSILRGAPPHSPTLPAGGLRAQGAWASPRCPSPSGDPAACWPLLLLPCLAPGSSLHLGGPHQPVSPATGLLRAPRCVTSTSSLPGAPRRCPSLESRHCRLLVSRCVWSPLRCFSLLPTSLSVLLLGCTHTEALTSLRPRVTAGAAPSPSSSLRPRAALPLLSSRDKPHLQPPELLPSPPATTRPFLCHGPASRVTRPRRTQGRKESPNWWFPHLGLSSLPPQFTPLLAAHPPASWGT